MKDILRKKFALTLLLWASGTALAFVMKSDLGAYTLFSTLLLGVFGTQDVVDKKMKNKNPDGE
jgi:hypothetical protein